MSTSIVREKLEPGIWRRQTARGPVLEITYRDAEGKQRRQKVTGGILAARKQLREAQRKRDRGERVTANPRLRFGEAADKWLTSREVKAIETRRQNAQMVEQHLRPRFGRRRLDAITPDDAAALVAAMRTQGYAEQTIERALGALGMICKYAARRLGGPKQNPVAELLPDERPKPGPRKHRIYRDGELEQTIAAARGQWRMLFQLDAVIGARMAEVLGLRWKDKDGDLIGIRGQVNRDGDYVEHGKNSTALREVPIPAELATLLDRHRAERALEGVNVGEDAYIFSTATGGPLDHRNVRRILKLAQTRARTPDGRPTFPGLHERDEHGKPVKVPRGAVPNFHSFRHQAASQYIADGWRVEEVADLLGDTVKTIYQVYRHQIDNAERRRQRTERMAASFGSVLAASAATEPGISAAE